MRRNPWGAPTGGPPIAFASAPPMASIALALDDPIVPVHLQVILHAVGTARVVDLPHLIVGIVIVVVELDLLPGRVALGPQHSFDAAPLFVHGRAIGAGSRQRKQ